ncbi:xanthine dehydrogenase family protein molybdopterin-binding subunit [Tissierella sp. MB52-C2]|uniref:xanthine dehydrogenase family protein molybdopterin-binding subunit n=1 Tax=Tissierella sp. MB52-C2 TaxID=3070999 RepID=UPI00280B348E|nr:xanthine dehydrogenase family protein molybdopterin-binding subunit [Tissierella sp. MB52-C2]WMM23379.1 xanthine dehydrogenase family protein molybdopterin-binding subunit [Tissierella sp. MB52-C2]
MESPSSIGITTIRKESWDKVTGSAKYNSDNIPPNTLHAKLLTSTIAHGLIKSINIDKALKSKGVQNIITGDYYPVLTGSIIKDRPPIARDKVRYFGEPVAVVIANSEEEAMKALNLIEVEYDPLPVVASITEALKPNATLVHENLGNYYCPDYTVYPVAHTNMADHVKIRKGNMELGWSQSDVIVESTLYLPKSDHLAMETRNAIAEITPSGIVNIYTSSQSPFAAKEELNRAYKIPEGNIIVHTPLVGGAFGGKATIQLEHLAYLASSAVGGRMVKITNTREDDITISPSKVAAEGKLKIGATKEGIIKALECTYYTDCGAYADTGPRMAKSIAIDCSGPYNIENLHCDSISVYTNHGYVTSFRGFGHGVCTFGIERLLDKLALKLNMDPFDIRIKNAIIEGNTSPTQDIITFSNTGNLTSCLLKLKQLMKWDEGQIIKSEKGTIIAKGIASLWKTSNSPTNASSGVVLTLNDDGSINLNFGASEIGPGMKTTIAQILAERMKMDVENIHVFMDVNTQVTPKHWKTVASMTTFMVGNAALNAAQDLINQLKEIGGIALKCSQDDLEIANQKVYVIHRPDIFISFKDLVNGYQYSSGKSIYGQIIAKGSYIVSRLTPLDKETGKGKPSNSWTVAAQAVEIEYNPANYSYRLLKAFTVIDAGRVINPKAARGVVMGGMSMGLGLATREDLIYDKEAILQNSSLRTYKLIRFGENPEYIVDFIETPQIDAPYGARGIAEHGTIGIPAAFANAISLAVGADFDTLPISNEVIWKTKTGGKYDSL